MSSAASQNDNVCVPCSGLDASALLSQDQVDDALKSMPLWKLQEDDGVHRIARQFVTKNFQTALDAMNAFGAIAERNGHHPDLHLVNYREVEIVLWTHKVGGLTRNDFELAKVFDSEVEVCYSPKWLREHPEADRNARVDSGA